METIGKGLIIVEDEPLISLMIEDIAHDLGWLVVGSVHTEEDAFRLLGQCQPRVALLDINLGLTTSLAVASSCQDRGIPVIFITGYTARDVPSQCGGAPILAKPFSPCDLERSLKRILTPENSAA
ncbi:response regulator [Devosia algicola]|uniref:Response regulator n=1 Tax=Devosia algicola TaxID=3026418 RepID=A0ABY7YNS1_9HYPH|nr:response regulator [Devosia algicola]WDR02710.1 response regulator [Devosia algicola]